MGVVLALAILLVTLFWLFQRRLIYYPSSAPVPPAVDVLPGAQHVTLETEDGLALGAWFVPAGPPKTSPPGRAMPAVLVANGNAGDRSLRAPLAQALVREGLSVLLFDYRGYGANPGSPSEKGLLADARAATDLLAERDDVDAERIVYYAESLGTGVVTALAAERPPAALVLRSPFPSLAEVGRLHYPFLPVGALLRDRYPVAEQVGRIRRPLLVIAGEQDRLVPPELSRRLYEAAGEPKEMVVIPGAGHNDRALLDGELMIAAIIDFLRTTADVTLDE
ncbi:MAG: alpha/beta fold hydrolase [Nitriliruptorales bacterium]|nr:alpha/beta fold hydrolase [Nitriliruptorales bacterium]